MIVLADQFTKDKAISYINGIAGLKTILTSGTVKKLKKTMETIIEEESPLLKEGDLLLGKGKN